MFSHQLTKAADPILQAIYDHPFVQGIGDGHVDDAALKFYVEQDFQYLSEFIKIYASIIPLLKDREDMRFFAENIDFILNSEIHPHHVFCDIAGVEYESLQHATPSPKAYLYQSHMYRAVQSGKLINIICELLPCPWTYNEIAKQITALGKNTDTNQFKSWIDFYMDDGEASDGDLTRRLFNMVDDLATNLSEDDLNEAKQYFLKSTELEWEFWQQAFYQEGWRFADVIEGDKNA